MQSGYGVSEFQQFMVDGGSSMLSISHDISNSSQSQKHHQLHLQEQQHQHPHHHQQQQQRFYHLHQNSSTQQLFQHSLQFQLLQQQQQQRRLYHQGLDQESGPENDNSSSRIISAGGTLPFIVANFKRADENSCSREALNDNDTMLVVSGDGEGRSDSRETIADHQRWQHREEAIKELFWTPLDTEYINRNNKRSNVNMEVSNKHCKKADDGNENEEGKNSGSNYGLFGELEAIYTHGSGSGSGGGNNQAGSGSALTGDNPLTLTTVAAQRPAVDLRSGIDHGSEASAGEEASLQDIQKNRRKKKRKQLSCIASFFESLVKQLMDHQETLHRKFVEVMEKRYEERTNLEEAWRRQEMAKSNREAIARAQERDLASSREAAIVALLEKITGKSIDLPIKSQFNFQTQFHEDSLKEENANQHKDAFNSNNVGCENNTTNTRRWPKAEVHALVRVRSSLESRFQEPGLKGALWEEVSSSMATMGYQRSAKRCKEKWENINKYFRKTKASARKRSQYSKTCPYFSQLDQLYSKSANPSVAAIGDDAIVVSTDQNQSLVFVQGQLDLQFPGMESQGLDFNGNDNDNLEGENQEDNEDDEDVDDDEEGGENQGHMQKQGIERVR